MYLNSDPKLMLQTFSAGKLPVSLSIAMSAQIELCDVCTNQISEIEASLSSDTWKDCPEDNADFGDMLQDIMNQCSDENENKDPLPKVITKVGKTTFTLPMAFRSFDDLKWSGFGPVTRARVINDEKNVRASLLHIAAKGQIPTHRHKGFELTLLLSGSFTDEMGSYHPGDFIWIDGELDHSPYTEEGCLCYAVQNAPLHFIKGMSKVLNPLGNLIY